MSVFEKTIHLLYRAALPIIIATPIIWFFVNEWYFAISAIATAYAIICYAKLRRNLFGTEVLDFNPKSIYAFYLAVLVVLVL